MHYDLYLYPDTINTIFTHVCYASAMSFHTGHVRDVGVTHGIMARVGVTASLGIYDDHDRCKQGATWSRYIYSKGRRCES